MKNLFNLEEYILYYQKIIDGILEETDEDKFAKISLRDLSYKFNMSQSAISVAINIPVKYKCIYRSTKEKFQIMQCSFEKTQSLQKAKKILDLIKKQPDLIMNFKEQGQLLDMSSWDLKEGWEVLFDTVCFNEDSHTDYYINRLIRSEKKLKKSEIKLSLYTYTYRSSLKRALEEFNKENIDELLDFYNSLDQNDPVYKKTWENYFDYRLFIECASIKGEIIREKRNYEYLRKHCIPKIPIIDRKIQNGLYICSAFIEGNKRLYKIGVTSNLKKREGQFRMEYREPVQVIHFIPTDFNWRLEEHFHQLFKNRNVLVKKIKRWTYSREWFDLREKDLKLLTTLNSEEINDYINKK